MIKHCENTFFIIISHNFKRECYQSQKENLSSNKPDYSKHNLSIKQKIIQEATQRGSRNNAEEKIKITTKNYRYKIKQFISQYSPSADSLDFFITDPDTVIHDLTPNNLPADINVFE